MHEIEQILNDNLGNRLTPALVIGLMALITHIINASRQEAPAPNAKNDRCDETGSQDRP